MKCTKLKTLLLIMLLAVTSGFSATLTATTLYLNSGIGNVNTIGDTVNGKQICAQNNTYTNDTPGCDMYMTVKYNDNGTGANNDDYYQGDLIVRTNDVFTVGAKYSFNGALSSEDTVTMTAKLPEGTGFVWDSLPTVCAATGSSISTDRKTLVCVRENLGKSWSEVLELPVKVEGDAPNGTIPGDIKITYEAPNTPTITDGVEDGKAKNLMKITASPRWNIDKTMAQNMAPITGKTDPAGNKGWYVYYLFHIGVDEVDGEVDNVNQSYLGSEALAGAKDATVTFKDDLSTISPNAKLVTWDNDSNFSPANNACGTDYYYDYYSDPYPVFNADYPERSVSTAKGVMKVSCTEAGQMVTVTLDHMDATLEKTPTQEKDGDAMPVNRKVAAIIAMKVFIPYSDVVGQQGDELHTNNTVSDFKPKGVSGTENFGGLGESEADNNHPFLLRAGSSSFSKSFRAGWSSEADQSALWGGALWSDKPTNASVIFTGDGNVAEGTYFGTYAELRNRGVANLNDATICDVIDINTFSMEVISDTDNPNTQLDDTKHAIDLEAHSEDISKDINVSYAIGYVGTWPPDVHVAGDLAVRNECGDASITWYADYVSAKAAAVAAGTDVSKVRISIPVLPEGEYLQMRIKQKAKGKHMDGTPILPGEILANYATYKHSLQNDGGGYLRNNYIPNDETMDHVGVGGGDRLIFGRAKVRIAKSMQPSSLALGEEANVTLNASFTYLNGLSTTGSIVIVDVLPEGLAYKAGSTTGAYNGGTNYGEPTVIENATSAECNTYASTIVELGYPCGTLNGSNGKEMILVWDLGTLATGTVFDSLNFTTSVKVDSPAGVLHNYAQIESDNDTSKANLRVANANVNVSVPSALIIAKEVITPLHEINNGGLLNWIEFRVAARNGGGTNMSNLDIIDVLPFNGDGTSGNMDFTPQDGTTTHPVRSPATNYTGEFQLDSVGFDPNGVCDATNIEFWFTKKVGVLDLSPNSTTNTKVDGTPEAIWCQGTTSGPSAGCGFTNAEVTAVRSRNVGIESGATCFLTLRYATNNNSKDNVYSNTAGANAVTPTGAKLDGVLSNTVSASVYASSIGNFVWYDLNKNGIQDAGESGVDGITVKLYRETADTVPANNNSKTVNSVSTAITENGGLYKFSNLTSGNYIVEIVPGTNFITSKIAGGNNTLDSNFDTNTHKTDVISLGMNEDIISIDAGLVPLDLSISGTIFNDSDEDGNVNGVAISEASGTQLHATLLNADGTALSTVPIAADGTYNFSEGILPNTDYTVILATSANATIADLPTNWHNTGENVNSFSGGNDDLANGRVEVSVGTESIPLVDFGIVGTGTGSWIGSVTEDTTKDDNGDTPIENVLISLYTDPNGDGKIDDGVLVGTTTTSTTGSYRFDDLEVGDYVAVETQPVNLINLKENEGGADNDKPDNGVMNSIAGHITAGEVDNANNFVETRDNGFPNPEVTTAHIGDYFWVDKNSNGIQDSGEKPIIGAKVELFDANGNPVTDENGQHEVTTDANGKYGFDVKPGTYQVKFNLPDEGYDGYVFSNANQGDDAKDTDVNNKGFTQIVTVKAGENILTLDAGTNCACANMSNDSADAQSKLSILMLMFFTLVVAFYFVRREENKNV